MPLKNYCLLKGTVLGHKRDADDDHYQILVDAGGQLCRIAVNVLSASKVAPSIVLYHSSTSLPDGYKDLLRAAKGGRAPVASKPGGLALDYQRDGWFPMSKLIPLAPNQPGDDNDLKDKLEAAVVRAIKEPGSIVYALGEKWGPEKTKADKYFKFKPGNGIHDIHMNQGNGEPKYRKYNGIHQDGALLFEYPGDKWRLFFLAFQSQSQRTDDKGNPLPEGMAPSPAPRSARPSRVPASRRKTKGV